MTGVLLRASTLHTLTLFDGRRAATTAAALVLVAGSDGAASPWADAVAALVSGLRGGASALKTLNFRHFHLGRDGGVVAASLA